MDPLVSILIPAYNAERWLAETIKSAQAQTWSRKEIIIVDDGSTDDTVAVAHQFQCSDIKVIRQKNQWQGAARNRAFRESQGDFIQYLDADDLLAPDKIEIQMKTFMEIGPEYIASCEWGKFRSSPAAAVFEPEPVWASMNPVDWLICSWDDGGEMHGAAWLIPRRLIDQAGPWNERLRLGDDTEFYPRLLLVSKGVRFCVGAKTYYRTDNAASVSSRRSRQVLESVLASLDLATSYLLAAEDSPRARQACATCYQRYVYLFYPDAPDLIERAEGCVRALGGTPAKISGTPLFQLLSPVLGWKRALLFQRWLYRHGYNKLKPGHHLARLMRMYRDVRHAENDEISKV
jgi:glycosyltransferase involved in cell wall biosynthesis